MKWENKGAFITGLLGGLKECNDVRLQRSPGTWVVIWASAVVIFMNGGGEWLTRELVETHLLSGRIGASESPSPGMQRSGRAGQACWPSSEWTSQFMAGASCFLYSSKVGLGPAAPL